MQVIRIFPSKTRATPLDSLSVINQPPGMFDKADEIHISCLFTWDKKQSEYLARQWEQVAPVKMGGPAFNSKGDEFTPGLYIKKGYVITSRGCPNKCWFCSVWRREGGEIRELEIKDGYNILDDNLLACSKNHIISVFQMLRKQKEPIEFTGGWEAKRLENWHIDLLKTIRLGQVWFAYDEDADLEPLIEAGKKLKEAGISITKTGNVSHSVRCYCLVGYPKDTLDKADIRLKTAYKNGFLPMAMLYRNEKGETTYEWQKFQKYWARPASINRMCRDNSFVNNLNGSISADSVSR